MLFREIFHSLLIQHNVAHTTTHTPRHPQHNTTHPTPHFTTYSSWCDFIIHLPPQHNTPHNTTHNTASYDSTTHQITSPHHTTLHVNALQNSMLYHIQPHDCIIYQFIILSLNLDTLIFLSLSRFPYTVIWMVACETSLTKLKQIRIVILYFSFWLILFLPNSHLLSTIANSSTGSSASDRF